MCLAKRQIAREIMANTPTFKVEKALAQHINHMCPGPCNQIVAYLLLFIIMIRSEWCPSGVNIGK